MPLLEIPYPEPLLCGTLLRRYNRFFADVELDGTGERIVAHCVNTGSMEGLTLPGLRVWVSHNPSPKRKLHYTWQIAEVDGYRIGANTAMPNKIVGALLEQRLLPGFKRWKSMRAEAKYGENSRVDFLLEENRGLHYVEVKNCHLIYPDGYGYFPDSVSERAAKHLRELMVLVREGHRASVIFTAQRTNVRGVRPSDAHDPVFAATAREAHAAGMKFLALQIRPDPEALIVEKVIPADLAPYDTASMAEWRRINRAAAPSWRMAKAK